MPIRGVEGDDNRFDGRSSEPTFGPTISTIDDGEIAGIKNESRRAAIFVAAFAPAADRSLRLVRDATRDSCLEKLTSCRAQLRFCSDPRRAAPRLKGSFRTRTSAIRGRPPYRVKVLLCRPRPSPGVTLQARFRMAVFAGVERPPTP